MSLDDTAAKIPSMEIRGAGKIAREAAKALRDHAEKHHHSILKHINRSKLSLP